MAALLFVTYGGGHVNMLIPLLRRLMGRDDYTCVVLGLTTADRQLAQHGIACRGFVSLLRDGDDSALEWGEKLALDLPPGGLVNRKESVAYLGLSYVDLETRVGEKEAARQYAKIGRQAFLPLSPIRRLFDEVNPDLVITTISPRAEQAAQIVARERGISSLCLIDLFGRPSIHRASEMGYGSRVCVISEGVRQRLIAAGRKPDEVVVTGNPAFDCLKRSELKNDAQRLRCDRDWGDDRVILWASQLEPERNPFTGNLGEANLPQKIEKHLLDVIARHAKWRLVIRPHPNDSDREMSTLDRVEISGRDDDLPTLLMAVDVVIIMTSTVGLEARLLGKPLVSVDLSVFSQDTPYQDMGLSLGISSLEDLEAALQQAMLQGEDIPDGFPAPGTATDAILQQIELLITEAETND